MIHSALSDPATAHDLKVARANLPTRYGTFTAMVFEEVASGREEAALVMGEVGDGRPVLTRMHSECLTGDVLGSLRCDCGPQLAAALQAIAAEGRGVLLYLRQEGRGIGLYNKLRAYALQEQGLDTVEANERLGFPADLRDYRLAARILRALGVRGIRLLTNNPKKLLSLAEAGIEVVGRVPLLVPPNAQNLSYLRTKREKMGHLFGDGHLDLCADAVDGLDERDDREGRADRNDPPLDRNQET
jgi:GTP cyclohydrolase II